MLFSLTLFLKFFFFNVGHCLSLYWICYNIASVFLCFGVLARDTWGVLATCPWIGPTLPSLKDEVLTTGQKGKPLFVNFFLIIFSLVCFGYTGSSLWLFSSCSEWGPLSSCGVWASHCGGLSRCGTQALGTLASVVVAHGHSCSMACGISPGPRIQSMFSALAGKFLTTGPPERSSL